MGSDSVCARHVGRGSGSEGPNGDWSRRVGRTRNAGVRGVDSIAHSRHAGRIDRDRRPVLEPVGMTANDIVVRIQQKLAGDGIAWRSQTVDTFKAGAPETEVRAMATTGM